MGEAENRHAIEVRRRLLMPPNAVPDPGIDLRRLRQVVPPKLPPAPEPELPPPPLPISQPSPVPPIARPSLSPTKIIELVSKHYGFTAADLLGSDRKSKLALARHIAIWFCLYYFPKRSTTSLAMLFQKDHTSILHARNRMRRHLGTLNPEGKQLQEIQDKLEDYINDRN